MRLHVGKAALQENVGVISNDGVDASGLYCRRESRRPETNGITYFRRRRDSLTLVPVEDWGFSGSSGLFHLREFDIPPVWWCENGAALCRRRPAFRGETASAGIPATMKLPITNKMPGGSETQKILRHAVSLKAKSFIGSPSFATSSTRITEIHPNQGRCYDAERQQPLENSRPFAATRCRQAFRQVEWNNHADQAGTDALQQSAKNQRLISMRKRNYGNAGNKQKSAERPLKACGP